MYHQMLVVKRGKSHDGFSKIFNLLNYKEKNWRGRGGRGGGGEGERERTVLFWGTYQISGGFKQVYNKQES